MAEKDTKKAAAEIPAVKKNTMKTAKTAEKENSGSREDRMYDVLRADILDLKLRPGLVFSIKDVCDAYEVGRTPVREALIRLSKEGLITFLPQRGTMVSRIDFQRADNERFLRSCVEEQVMLEFMALSGPDSAAAAALKESLDRQEKIVKDRDCRAFLEEDMVFHSVFYQGADRETCARIIHANSGDYRRIRLLSLTETGISDGVVRQHRELMEAVLMRDRERVHRLLALHLNKMVKEERFLMEKYAESFTGGEAVEKRRNDGFATDFLAGCLH